MAALALASVHSRAGGSGFHNILEAKGLKIRHISANANRFSFRIPNKLQLKCHKTCQLERLYDKTGYRYPWRRSHTNRMLVFAYSAAEENSEARTLLTDVVVKKSRPLSSLLDRKWSSADMTTAVVVFGMHALCLLAPFTFTWKAFGVFLMLYVITGLLGITLSYHRNLSHRSFKLPKWLEYIFAYCGAQALQGDPLDWVSTHRYHHQFCDSVKDPHSPNEGFWFSHMSWMFDEKSMLNRIGKRNNVTDLEKQPFYRFLQSTYIIHPIALALSLYALGGLPFLVWGMAVRVVWVYHITWFVNSACHVWGYQSWNTGDLSRNNWWVAALAFGEGWHNNHHAFEFSARHGLEWWQLDITWYVIQILEAVGLAKDIRLPSEQHKARMSF